MKKFLALVIVFFAILPAVLSIAVTPGRTTLTFVPDLEKEITVKLLNPENTNTVITVTVDGALKNYITLEKNQLVFENGEGKKEFSYKLKLPKELAEPGIHEARLIFAENPSGSNFINTAMAVATQLYVDVPYPNKYLVIDGIDVKEEEGVKFRVGLTNKGREDIEEAYADLKVKKAEEVIYTEKTQTVSVESMKRNILEGFWKNKKEGEYTLLLSVNYDGNKEELSQNFTVHGLNKAEKKQIFDVKDYIIPAIITVAVLLLIIFFALRKFNIVLKGN